MPDTPLTCPHCRSPLVNVTDGMIGERYHPGYLDINDPIPMRWRLAPFLACSGCDYCVEYRGDGSLVPDVAASFAV